MDFGSFKVMVFRVVRRISAHSKLGRSGFLDGLRLIRSHGVQVCWTDFGSFKVMAFKFVRRISAHSKSGRSGLLDGFLLMQSHGVQVC